MFRNKTYLLVTLIVIGSIAIQVQAETKKTLKTKTTPKGSSIKSNTTEADNGKTKKAPQAAAKSLSKNAKSDPPKAVKAKLEAKDTKSDPANTKDTPAGGPCANANILKANFHHYELPEKLVKVPGSHICKNLVTNVNSCCNKDGLDIIDSWWKKSPLDNLVGYTSSRATDYDLLMNSLSQVIENILINYRKQVLERAVTLKKLNIKDVSKIKKKKLRKEHIRKTTEAVTKGLSNILSKTKGLMFDRKAEVQKCLGFNSKFIYGTLCGICQPGFDKRFVQSKDANHKTTYSVRF